MRGAAAGLVLLLASAGACCSKEGSFTFREPAAATPGAAPPLSGPIVRVLHFGDFGANTCQQEAVAAAMGAAHRRAPFDVAFADGDNLYDCGPDAALPGAAACAFAADGATVAGGFAPPDDPAFVRLHERPLAALRGVPVHLALGNHDVSVRYQCSPGGLPLEAASRVKACLEVAHVSGLWSMPARHYAVDAGLARFIVVDANLADGDYGGFGIDAEVAFVAEAASAAHCPPERACFLVGHQAPATAGSHAGNVTEAFAARMDRLVAAGGGRIRAWLAGHDHDLQHLRTPSGLDVFVSGNSARQRPDERFARAAPPGAELVFASVRWGFGVLEVGSDGWDYRFVAADGRPLHCCASRGGGRCEPAACP
jgi:hypothetical protein